MHTCPMRRVIVGLVAAALGMTTPSALAADPPSPPQVALTVATPPPTYAGLPATVTGTLTADAGPVPGEPVQVERLQAGTWVAVDAVVTDAAGIVRTAVTASRVPADNAVRLSYRDAGGQLRAQATTTIPLLRRASRLTVSGPGRVVDEQRTRVTVTWRADDGEPVAGPVTLQVAEPRVVTKRRKRTVQWRWRTAALLTTDARGVATYTTAPRVDTRWRAVAAALPWVAGGSSGVHALDNRPPGRPVRLPAQAPRPSRRLPVQPHAVGAGPNPVLTPVPDAMWRSMVGRTWHAGCPVGRSGLRLVRVNYWDYTGYRRRGELVVATQVADQVAEALADLYRHQVPIRSMVREDRFGWSKRLRGADDYESMRAGNTSAFNCRGVVGNPRVRSPHSYGTALDLDTWENPYRSAQGTVPNRWWQSHAHPRVAWRSRGHLVVRIMARHGLRWTYGLGDTQHFDAVPAGAARPLLVECGLRVCE